MAKIKLYTRNILETGTVSVTGTPDTGYPEARLYDRAMSLYWKDTATDNYVFHVDQGATGAVAVDALIVENHNFDGETCQWQYSTDDFSGDINDAVTDWSQSGNARIVKTMSAAQTKRYWRLDVGAGASPATLTNPKAGEIFFTYGWEFEAQINPEPDYVRATNLYWVRSMGNVERSTRRGERRRRRSYTLLLSSSDLANFHSAMDELDTAGTSIFYITDHDSNTWPCRLADDPAETYQHDIAKTRITLEVIEML
jgi:hypothetical protein